MTGTPGKIGTGVPPPPPPPKPTSPLMGTVEETYAGSGYYYLSFGGVPNLIGQELQLRIKKQFLIFATDLLIP